MRFARCLLMMSVVAFVAGCETVRVFDCDWADPIYPSVDDALTDGTARDILTHNERGARFCGWQPIR